MQLRETWSKPLDAGHLWVFVCRKIFDPTSARKWFKDPLNKPKVHPHGPWETVDGGRAQYLWAEDWRYEVGPCGDSVLQVCPQLPPCSRLHLRSPFPSILRMIGLILRAPSWNPSFVPEAPQTEAKFQCIWEQVFYVKTHTKVLGFIVLQLHFCIDRSSTCIRSDTS